VRYLLYLDAALAALGAAMSLCISYVCLVYVLYRDAAPEMRSGLHPVLVVAACCLALALVAGAAAYGLWRRRAWHWAAQAALAAFLPCAFLAIHAELAA
jgi:hypothetical protein